MSSNDILNDAINKKPLFNSEAVTLVNKIKPRLHTTHIPGFVAEEIGEEFEPLFKEQET